MRMPRPWTRRPSRAVLSHPVGRLPRGAPAEEACDARTAMPAPLRTHSERSHERMQISQVPKSGSASCHHQSHRSAAAAADDGEENSQRDHAAGTVEALLRRSFAITALSAAATRPGSAKGAAPATVRPHRTGRLRHPTPTVDPTSQGQDVAQEAPVRPHRNNSHCQLPGRPWGEGRCSGVGTPSPHRASLPPPPPPSGPDPRARRCSAFRLTAPGGALAPVAPAAAALAATAIALRRSLASSSGLGASP